MSNNNSLKRTLTLFPSIMIVVTSVIGGGIFTVPGEVMGVAQGSGPNILAWTIAGCLCILSGMVYLELGPAMPKAGGPYVYLQEAYGDGASFLYGWISILNFSAVLAVLAFSFSNYLRSFIPYSDTMVKVVASLALIAAFTTNICGIKLSTKVNNGMTVAKLLVLGSVIVFGLFAMKGANFQPIASAEFGWRTTFSAAVPALFAFSGYVQICYMAEEVKEPKKTIPKALIIGIAIIIFFYTALSIVSTGVLSVQGVIDSKRVIASAGQAIFGPIGGTIITIGALISIYGTINSGFMSFPRLVFSMGRNGVFPSIFAKTNKKFGTPHFATLTYLAVALVLLWTGKIFDLLMLCTFIARCVTILVTSSLLVLRKKRPDMERPIKMPGFPVTFVMVLALDITMALLVPRGQILQGLIFGALAIPMYLIFKAVKKKEAKPEAAE